MFYPFNISPNQNLIEFGISIYIIINIYIITYIILYNMFVRVRECVPFRTYVANICVQCK